MSRESFSNSQTRTDRKEFRERVHSKNIALLWEVFGELIPDKPGPQCVPELWRYEEVRPLLMESGALIGTDEAVRRVLVLENPGIPGRSSITQSLYAGLQLVLPGEVAPTHRHVASAFRFVIESDGAYTAVDGGRTTMHPGDFIITPKWTWHDHGNPGGAPAVWLDSLDVPIVNFFNTGFHQEHPDGTQPARGPERDVTKLPPVDYQSGSSSQQIFNYPWSRTREALENLRNGPVNSSHGFKLRYIDPGTGDCPQVTHGAFIQLLPSGFRGDPYRSTDGTVYCVAEGSGRSQVGESRFEWKDHDVFVVPSWSPVSHETESGGILFGFSDRPAQEALGLWREERT